MKRTILAILMLSSSSAVAFAQERNVVTIALLPEAVLDDSVIYLDQIAKLSGSPALRQRLGRLDIAEFRLGLQRTTVTSDQVKFRLMLAGIPMGQFQLTGAARTLVSEGSDPISARKIRAAAERTMFAGHPGAGPSRDIIAPLLDVKLSDRVQFDADIVNATRVDVAILVNGKVRETVRVPFESVTKTSAALPRPKLDLPREKSEVLIKSRDLIKIVANVGAAQVVASGEAQQDGKRGEIIRVRNTESNRSISARVESAGIVIVDY